MACSSKPVTFVQITVSGDCGGHRYLYRADEKWQLTAGPVGERASETSIPQEIVWPRVHLGTQVRLSGDSALGLHLLKTISIVA
jgi:hypothetical protein